EPGLARRRPPARRPTALAGELLRLAYPSRLRHRARASDVVDPRRARVLLRHRRPHVVAARAGRAAAARIGRPGGVRLRGLRARLADRSTARTPATPGLRLLRGRHDPRV